MRTCSCVTRPPSLLLFSFLLILLLFASAPARPTSAAPIRLPNLRQCQNATDVSVSTPIMTLNLNCCLPIPARDVIHFSFHRYKSPCRVRQAAHRVSKEYIAKYTRAYELMKALPDDDPRSFTVQQKIHCAFCNGAYRQTGSESVQLQMHFSWLFLPWHRWYLYFHERILQSLLGDDSFSLVFWNWDDQRDGGNVMPAMFVSPGTALYDSKRNQMNLPPALVKLAANLTGNDSVIINQNLNNMYKQVVTATTADLFMGGAYRTGTDLTNSTVLNAPLGGSIENGVHNGVHFWTGDPNQPLRQDMATFTTAAKDPIFYAHHSNVDRLWVKWNSGMPGGPRFDHSDPDFLHAEFYFYDETGSLVKVTVKDALDSSKLGVSYPDVAADDLWANYSPPVTTSGSAVKAARESGALDIAPWPNNNGTIFPVGSRLVAIAKMPTSPRPNVSSAEVLVIQGVQLIRNTFGSLHAFLNLPSADSSTPTSSAEYLGAYNIIPSVGRDGRLTATIKFEIGDNLQRIGLQKEKEVVITLTVWGSEHVTIQGLLIEYES